MWILINALGANNNSSCIVIRNHIVNLNTYRPQLKIVVFTTPGALIINYLKASSAVCDYTYFQARFAGISLRLINEFVLLPLYCFFFLTKNSVLATFSGYPIWMSPLKQVVYFQNPMPYIYEKLTMKPGQALKQSLLLQITRFLSLFISSKDVYLFNSVFMMNICKAKLCFINKPEIQLCFNAVMMPSRRKNAAKQFPGISKQFLVISIAPFEKYKNNHLIFDAFVELAMKYPNARLIHVGAILDRDYFNTIISTIPSAINERIEIYTDRVSSSFLHNLMESASVYCSASSCESFGLPAVESQSYGVPCIVQESTAAAEIAGNGGIICDYNDRRCLSTIIDGWSINSQEYYQLSLNSLANYKKYSSSNISIPLLLPLNKDKNSRN